MQPSHRSRIGNGCAHGAADPTPTAVRRPAGSFDFGEARTAWERVHGEAAERIAAWLPDLPAAVRRYAQAEAYRRLHASGAGPYHGEAVAAALAEVDAALGHQSAALPQAAE